MQGRSPDFSSFFFCLHVSLLFGEPQLQTPESMLTDAFNVQMQLAKPAQFRGFTVPRPRPQTATANRNLSVYRFFNPWPLRWNNKTSPLLIPPSPEAIPPPFPSRDGEENLPLHLVGLVALAQAERAGEVAGEELDLLDVGDQSLVDGLLVRRPAAVDLLLLWLKKNGALASHLFLLRWMLP